MKFPWYIWIPRILIVLLACFMAMFSLDAINAKAGLWQNALGFLMHSIPSLILLLMLVLTWKRPFLGGIIFASLTIIFSVLIAIFFTKFIVFDLLAFALPMLIGAALFFFANYKKT
jgi:hypothetical protein